MQIPWEMNITCIVQALQCPLQKAYSACWAESLDFFDLFKNLFLDLIAKKRTQKILSNYIQNRRHKILPYCVSYNLS